MDEMNKEYYLLTILLSYAPNEDAQAKCTAVYNRMQAGNLSVNEKVRQLAGAIVDGLSHGNWPWDDWPRSGPTLDSHTIKE